MAIVKKTVEQTGDTNVSFVPSDCQRERDVRIGVFVRVCVSLLGS